jgi:hypothetical protein
MELITIKNILIIINHFREESNFVFFKKKKKDQIKQMLI